jgi:catechol-2,3-dioxygenase
MADAREPRITKRSARTPILRGARLASGTLPSRDLGASRRFYETVLGLDVFERSSETLVVKMGGKHAYLVERATTAEPEKMVLLNHNGFYLDEATSVEEAHAFLQSVKDEHGIRVITNPNWQHGYFAFFIQDADGNWWEFHHAPKGERQDLSGTAALDGDAARKWFNDRRQARGGTPA